MQSNVISQEMLERGPVSGFILDGILPVYKKRGQTPLECLTALRAHFEPLSGAILSYAGRLDPLAEGLMLVMVGKDTNRKRATYLNLDKTYEVNILFGIATDTGDLLGMPASLNNKMVPKLEQRSCLLHGKIVDVLPEFVGAQEFEYPAYSSKTVQGKPLHEWAKEGRLGEITIPKKNTEIYGIELIDMYNVSAGDVLAKTKESVSLVSGNFRQKEILSAWDEVFVNNFSKSEIESSEIESKVVSNYMFNACKIRVRCSSGTYMRTLSEEIGKKLGVQALAYDIERTVVGSGEDAINLSQTVKV